MIIDSAIVLAWLQHDLVADFLYMELINWDSDDYVKFSAVDIRKGIY